MNESDPTGMRGGPPSAYCNGRSGAAFQSCLDRSRYDRTHPDFSSIAPGCPPGISGWDCFVMSVDPAYWAISGAYNAYQLAQNPCSSNWEIAEQADNAFVGVLGTLLSAFGGAALVPSQDIWSIDSLAQSGANLNPADLGQQYTYAGTAYQKGAGGVKSLWAGVNGPPSAWNGAGQVELRTILMDPGTYYESINGGQFAGGRYYISPSGIGAAFDPSGQFVYFGRFTYAP